MTAEEVCSGSSFSEIGGGVVSAVLVLRAKEALESKLRVEPPEENSEPLDDWRFVSRGGSGVCSLCRLVGGSLGFSPSSGGSGGPRRKEPVAGEEISKEQ